MMFCKFYFMYKVIEVFTVLKMNIMTKASKFDVRKGPHLQIKFKRALQMPIFR